MLKETKTEEKKIFFVTFLSLMALQSGGGGGGAGHAYDFNFNAICDIKILCAFLLVCPGCMSKRH